MSDDKLKRITGVLKEYWVDFECWNIIATSDNDAEQIALNRIKQGEIPDIVNIEEHKD